MAHESHQARNKVDMHWRVALQINGHYYKWINQVSAISQSAQWCPYFEREDRVYYTCKVPGIKVELKLHLISIR